MSVAVANPLDAARPCASLSGSHESQEDIDWGSATPVNAIADTLYQQKLDDALLKRSAPKPQIPHEQEALLLHGLRQPFRHTYEYSVPELQHAEEVLVRIQAIGLNPIDWKSVDFGFGIPVLPYCAGRDFAGIVAKASPDKRFAVGDVVLCASTDYRDLRKAAFQQYAVASQHTLCRLPSHIAVAQGAALGVAFVAASLALAISLGLALPSLSQPKKSADQDIRRVVRRLPLENLPADVVPECLSILEHERPKKGDWIAIWGGSSTTALFISQIAELAGLRVILVADLAKHGLRLMPFHDYTLVDSHDSNRAAQIIKEVTGGELKFGVDTVGKESADSLSKCLDVGGERRPHIVGLAALPKERVPGVVYHTVPVKLFHEVPDVGKALMAWLGEALRLNALALPVIEESPGGLAGVNAALDRMRQGHISGRRLVVPLRWDDKSD